MFKLLRSVADVVLVGAETVPRERYGAVEPLMGGDPLPVGISPTAGNPKRYRMAHALCDGDTLFLRYTAEAGPRR